MKNLMESEFLSFLYAEKERLHTNFSKPGWNNWVIGGAFIALLGLGFNILTTSITLNLCVDWEAVLMLFIVFLSVTLIAMMIYPSLVPKTEIYYPNRISTSRNESPTLELVISGLSFLTITTLLIVNNNYSLPLYVFGYLSLEKLFTMCLLFYKRNELVSSGSKYDFIPKLVLSGTRYNSTSTNNWVNNIISIGLFISVIYSSWDYIREFNLYLNELQISAVFLGFWVLIFIFLKTNSKPNKMLNGIDNIIEMYVYSGISQQDAMEELMCLRYGSSMNQVIQNDKKIFLNALTKLEPVNAQLDSITKIIDEDKLTPQHYYEWLNYCKNERPKVIDAISKTKKLIEKLDNIDNIPNNVKYSDDFKSLITLTKSGLGKIEATQDKFKTISERFTTFRETYYCRKSGSFCTDLECTERNNKMSIKYALKKFPLKYALYLIIFRKR